MPSTMPVDVLAQRRHLTLNGMPTASLTCLRPTR